MLVKNPDIDILIEKISVHYMDNLGNRYLRPAFMSLSLDRQSWDLIAGITEKLQFFSGQGFHLDELYERILALARFIYATRKEVAPNLRTLLNGPVSSRGAVAQDRVIRDMAVSNFSSNLGILADLVNELYVLTVQTDKNMSGKAVPVYKSFPELQNLGRYLTP